MRLFFFAPLLIGTTSWAVEPHDILGLWHTAEKESQIEIYPCSPCAEDPRYCGKIVDITEKIYPADDKRGMAGKPKVDRENPNPSKRMQPIVGLTLMSGFRFNGKTWVDGEIYDPENGKTYRCKLTLVDERTLKVRGYIGISLLGRTEIWTRP